MRNWNVNFYGLCLLPSVFCKKKNWSATTIASLFLSSSPLAFTEPQQQQHRRVTYIWFENSSFSLSIARPRPTRLWYVCFARNLIGMGNWSIEVSCALTLLCVNVIIETNCTTMDVIQIATFGSQSLLLSRLELRNKYDCVGLPQMIHSFTHKRHNKHRGWWQKNEDNNNNKSGDSQSLVSLNRQKSES